MFARTVRIEAINTAGEARLCPLRQIDNFAMRNFTNDAVFDDTLPLADGVMEIGNRVPLPLLTERMEDWFRRKNYLHEAERLRITETTAKE
ncbi:MAG: hypothetical protein PW735_06590 [Acidobacteriaceae bacterium]|nr:hypothetical protein [Acidobacteriaceae bacterium]